MSDAEYDRDWRGRAERAEAELVRLRSVVQELNMNANNLLSGGLGWFSRRDFAAAVADRTKAILAGGR